MFVYISKKIILAKGLHKKKNWNELNEFKKICENDGGQLLDDSRPMICIPKEHMFYIHSVAENPTNITIELHDVQIIKIDMKLSQLTINMEIRIRWIEKDRLLLVTNQNEWIHISESNIQKLIWSPKIVIRKHLISQERSENVLQLAKDSDESNSTKILKIFNLFATVKCQMDVHTFPFDQQECILNVSLGLQDHIISL